MDNLYLILGGARSGKSHHAEALVEAAPQPWRYIATAQALDDEMRRRIEEHRSRRGTGWQTVEAPLELAAALDTCVQRCAGAGRLPDSVAEQPDAAGAHGRAGRR